MPNNLGGNPKPNSQPSFQLLPPKMPKLMGIRVWIREAKKSESLSYHLQYIISSCPFRGFLIQIMYRRSFNSSFFNMEAFIVILAIVILVGLYALFLYNSLVSRRNRVDEGWSDIDVQLKRRHDLIPNLVESVKGYASHEQETLQKSLRREWGHGGKRPRQKALAALKIC